MILKRITLIYLEPIITWKKILGMLEEEVLDSSTYI